ncbi:DUF2079 domain-containing protein [Sulfobacillus sp. hq2]|uniref:DUF2079 domain-containing protein n=1 Tax=Sulfobacillus TaxID=28033 RepID=UPI000CD1B848|nr:DUF2079 domain-containing protein [Sulfobacillus sp. hq2]POB11028.1 hypothetical protein CO251_05595 [Sulfobacillus sp. hq2]
MIPAFNTSPSTQTQPRWSWPQVTTIVVTCLFVSFQLIVSVHKFYNMEATTMDLGAFEQEMWNISHGNWWAFSSVFQAPAVSIDGFLWIYPIAYGFRFLGGAVFLFTLQSTATAISAWGIYRAARLHGLSEWQAAVVSMAFLLYPAIIGGSQFDFHPDFIALPFLIWAYVAYQAESKILSYILFLCAALSKNVAIISIGAFGFGLILWQHRIRDGLITLGGSLLFFFAEMDWIIPQYFDGGMTQHNKHLYAYLGHGYIGMLAGIVTHFSLVAHHLSHEGSYFIWILGPVLGLSLLGAASTPAMLSLLFLNALSLFPNQRYLTSQYQVILAGWLFLALIEALARFKNRRSRLLFGISLTTMILETSFLSVNILPLLSVTHPRTWTATQQANRHLSRNSVIWTQNRLGPWLYRYDLLGVDRQVALGLATGTLPELWHEAGSNHVTTDIVAAQPTTPYLADVLAHALHSGYHVSFHQGPLFIVSGMRHFRIPPQAPFAAGWQPRTRSWDIPIWTQKILLGHLNWNTQSLQVSQRTRGMIFAPIAVAFTPGLYHIAVTVHSPRPTESVVLGKIIAGRYTADIMSGMPHDTLTIDVRHHENLAIALWTSGHQNFSLSGLTISQ